MNINTTIMDKDKSDVAILNYIVIIYLQYYHIEHSLVRQPKYGHY
jgi:hypothetical protein